MLPVKNIYIDSRATTDDSQSTSNCAVEWKVSFTMLEDTAFTIADVLIPRTWHMVMGNINNSLYVLENRSTVSNPDDNLRLMRVTLEMDTYDGEGLASAIQKGFLDPLVTRRCHLRQLRFSYDVQ